MGERYPIPSVGAIIVQDGSILLVQRGTPPNQGQWSVPGGRLEWGETLAQAVRREVREETGLEVEVGELAVVTEFIDRQEAIQYHYIILDYMARVIGGVLTHGSDAAALRWVPLDAVRALSTTPGLLEVLAQRGLL